MCIDIEWGAFGDKGSLDFMRTEYDDILDQTSLLPGAYTYVLLIQANKMYQSIAIELKRFHWFYR